MRDDARGGRRARWIAAGAAALLLLLVAAAVAIVTAAPRERTSRLSLWTELQNFREVDPGRFYRSGQLSGEQLAEVIDELGIKSVVNLRGAPNEAVAWHREEIETARRHGARHYDVRLSARSVPHRSELMRLLDIYRDAERPILVHCEDGADRAGEAAAIYQIDHMDRSAEEALEMLTPRFLHFGWFRPAARYFVSRYRGARWARRSYDPCRLEYYDVERYCRPEQDERDGDGRRGAL